MDAFENAWQSMVEKLETKELAPNSRVMFITRIVDQRIEILVVDNGLGVEGDVLLKNFGVGFGLSAICGAAIKIS